MAAAARGPRRFITPKQRKLFGNPEIPLTWPAHANQTERLAAYRQHLLACAVNDARDDARYDVKLSFVAIAGLIGMRTETLRRKIRGEVWISWVDAVALARVFPDHPITPGQPLEIPPPTTK
jgi:hypothetical protein